MDDFLQLLTTPAVAIPFLLSAIFSVYSRLTKVSNIPGGVPWIGKDTSKIFAGTRASIAGFNNIRKWLEDGYDKYGKNNLSYILHNSFAEPKVILPRSQLAWLVEQPDDILSVSEFHHDTLEGDYTFTSPVIVKAPYHEHVIHKYLPRRVASLVPEMWEEVQVAIDQTWGMNTMEWKDVGFQQVLRSSDKRHDGNRRRT